MAADAWELRTARLEGRTNRSTGALVPWRDGCLQWRNGCLHWSKRCLRSEMLSTMDRQFFWILGILIVSGIPQFGLKFAGH